MSRQVIEILFAVLLVDCICIIRHRYLNNTRHASASCRSRRSSSRHASCILLIRKSNRPPASQRSRTVCYRILLWAQRHWMRHIRWSHTRCQTICAARVGFVTARHSYGSWQVQRRCNRGCVDRGTGTTRCPRGAVEGNDSRECAW
jgi:hypothetical protein